MIFKIRNFAYAVVTINRTGNFESRDSVLIRAQECLVLLPTQNCLKYSRVYQFLLVNELNKHLNLHAGIIEKRINVNVLINKIHSLHFEYVIITNLIYSKCAVIVIEF